MGLGGWTVGPWAVDRELCGWCRPEVSNQLDSWGSCCALHAALHAAVGRQVRVGTWVRRAQLAQRGQKNVHGTASYR